MLEVRNISKRFGETEVVSGVDFSTGPGEIFGIIGPNGAGKSTTIRMIMNIIAPDSGEILIGSRRMTPDDADRIGYLPEERGLYPSVKTMEMLRYLASLKGMVRSDADRQIDHWIERFDLAQWRDRTAQELSKGTAQKVQFIAAVLHRPDFVLLDEPFSGLDPVSTDLLREAILELGSRGTTVLFSTHNMEQAERICTSILLLDRGRALIAGPLADIKERYGKRSVEIEFDGDISFLEQEHAVAAIRRFPRWAEIEVSEGHTPDDVLQTLVGRVRILRFEVLAPSLHKVFVDLIGGAR